MRRQMTLPTMMRWRRTVPSTMWRRWRSVTPATSHCLSRYHAVTLSLSLLLLLLFRRLLSFLFRRSFRILTCLIGLVSLIRSLLLLDWILLVT